MFFLNLILLRFHCSDIWWRACCDLSLHIAMHWFWLFPTVLKDLKEEIFFLRRSCCDLSLSLFSADPLPKWMQIHIGFDTFPHCVKRFHCREDIWWRSCCDLSLSLYETASLPKSMQIHIGFDFKRFHWGKDIWWRACCDLSLHNGRILFYFSLSQFWTASLPKWIHIHIGCNLFTFPNCVKRFHCRDIWDIWWRACCDLSISCHGPSLNWWKGTIHLSIPQIAENRTDRNIPWFLKTSAFFIVQKKSFSLSCLVSVAFKDISHFYSPWSWFLSDPGKLGVRYGSGCLSFTESKTLLRLNWCDSGW